jgi:hypothetical protein
MKKARDFQGNHDHAKTDRKYTAPHNATPFIFNFISKIVPAHPSLSIAEAFTFDPGK